MYALQRKKNINKVYRVSQVDSLGNKFYSQTYIPQNEKDLKRVPYQFLFIYRMCLTQTGTLQNTKNQNAMLVLMLKYIDEAEP